MKKWVERQLKKNKLKAELREKIKREEALDKIEKGNSLDRGDKLGDKLVCLNCLKPFVKRQARQKFCSHPCRRTYWSKYRKGIKRTKPGKLGAFPFCKNCGLPLENNHRTRELCDRCQKLLATYKGRKQLKEDILDNIAEDILEREEGKE